ncbi:MAG: HEAT repeat domain-containing protein [Kofleriaceae bacterium]
MRSIHMAVMVFALAIAGPVFADDKLKPALTQEAYEKLVLGLADCKLKGYSIEAACPGLKAMQEAMRSTTTAAKDLFGMNAAIGAKLIGHTSPAVRVKAAELMGSIIGTQTTNQDTVAAAGAKEKDPQVLQAFIRVVANSGGKNPKVAAFLLSSADHADKAVRMQAVYAIASSWNKGMKGGVEKLAAMTDKDADAKVREAACQWGGELGDKKMLPALTKHTAKTDSKDMYTACMAGLGAMFHHYPLYGTDNQAAYKLFLDRIQATPRSEHAPPWTVMSLFRYAGDPKNDKLAAWKRRATWFKPADVKRALSVVIADKASNWMARTAALESFAALGANKAELEALKKGYDATVAYDSHVLKKIDELAAKAP